MTDATHNESTPARWKIGAWGVTATILAVLALVDWPAFLPTLRFTAEALAGTAPFIIFAVLAVAYLKASGAETLLARAFEGSPVRMIVLAALLGGLSPFCSCEVIPFIAALLAVGAPLAAVGLGLFGGFGVMLAANTPVFANPLRERPAIGGCCGTQKPFSGAPQWAFWTTPERRATFRETALENAAFLIKWLTLAYVIEALMRRYVPAEWIAGILGGDGVMPILLGALVGAPAYLNGYAAVPLVDALLAQGMTQGAAMSFVIAGGVSCIPAAIAVWALVKPRVFAAYLTFAMIGAVIAGLLWQWVA